MKRFVEIAALVWLVGFATGIARSQETAPPKLIEGAKKEGKLVWYTTMTVDQAQRYLKEFEKRYPFVKTEIYRAVSNKILNKIISDKNAGKTFADVVTMGGFQSFYLKKKGLTLSYQCPQALAIPEQFKDPQGYWVAFYQSTSVMAYNTRLVSSKDLPRTYQDLLDPKWKGRLGMDDSDEEWFANQCRIMGDEKCVSFMERLIEQKPHIIRGQNLLAQLLAAGEFAIAVVAYGHAIEGLKTTGAPVDWIAPDPILSKIYPMAILSDAVHPSAAKLFFNFALSREGQTLLKISKRIPTRSDVEPDPPRLTKGLNIRAADLSLAEKFDDYARLWRKLIEKK
ncbi:MAG: extracellular solute-binding protein [Deltaproteobacteria bacterium]|nr:extracellular solute-binding protein [Deltaproteobacteria bacterium]